MRRFLSRVGWDRSGERAATDGRARKLCEFAVPSALRDQLIEALLRGEKTATSSLVVEWEHESQPLPEVGERQTAIDSGGRPVAVIAIVAVDVMRLADADARLALQEGEGFGSVAEWREAHERFWNDQVRPQLRCGATLRVDDDPPVVVERFRLVERVDDT